jgi:hypothetical protein
MNLPVSTLLKPHPTMWDLPSEDPLEPGLPNQLWGSTSNSSRNPATPGLSPRRMVDQFQHEPLLRS